MTEASTPRTPTQPDADAEGRPATREAGSPPQGATHQSGTKGAGDGPTKDAAKGSAGGQPRTDPLKDVRHTRVSALWVGVIAASFVLIALLVFILQNSQRVTVSFLGFDVSMPLAVALLLSAVAGVLLVAIPGAARIAQLRRAVRKNR